ncbi:hypothetical protein Bca4012_020213 [Brassica carinata]|uniref:Uncharacterized protein n=1 Tax=Brassica carinata TaxID=52824 RepID=A0A8X7WIN3_BRACI|nr:hypothetical protein Bca52824_001371 [Brassica carinata]
MVSRIKQGSMSVPEYEELFLSHPIMKKKGKQYLIKIAIDGLKKEICDGLESTEFPTLRSLFQEASDVEDILEKEKKKRRLNSPRRRKKKRRLNRFVDPEDEWIFDDTTRIRDSKDSDDEDSDDEDSDEEESDSDWSYLGETTVDTRDDGSGSVSDHSLSGHGSVTESTAAVSGSVDDSPPR